MQTVRDTIEALIEESYLLTLSEGELDDELDRFTGLCKAVINENVQDMGRRRRLVRRIAAVHTTTLRSDTHSRQMLQGLFGKSNVRHLRREEKVRRVAGGKRAILKAIEEYEPQLVFFIEHDLSQPYLSLPLLEKTERVKKARRPKRWITICVGCLVLGTLMLLFYFAVKG